MPGKGTRLELNETQRNKMKRKESTAVTMHSVEEDIYPKRAARDLETARCGRNPSPKVIGNYARDMKAGNWPVTSQGVAYDTNGIFRDGQQRWWAVIKAATELAEEGKITSPDEFSVRVLVTYDMPTESFDFLDGGKPRSLSDTWHAEGIGNSVLLQTVCRRIAMWEAGYPVGNVYRPTKAETRAVLAAHPEAQEAAEFSDGWTVKPPILTPGIAGFLWWLLGLKAGADRDVFLGYLRDGTGLPLDGAADEKHPLVVLRNRLGRDYYEARQGGKKVKPETTLYLCLRAWDAWRDGERLSKLQMPSKLSDKSFRAPR